MIQKYALRFLLVYPNFIPWNQQTIESHQMITLKTSDMLYKAEIRYLREIMQENIANRYKGDW